MTQGVPDNVTGWTPQREAGFQPSHSVGKHVHEGLEAQIRVLETTSALSTNRPTNPRPGMTIYETDTRRVVTWTGTYWKLVSVQTYSKFMLSPFASTVVGAAMTVDTLTIANPGIPVIVDAACQGWVLDTTSVGPVDNTQWLEVSFNGGSSFSSFPGQVDTTNANASVHKYRGTWNVMAHHDNGGATPTGSVQVRLRVLQAGGSIGMKSWQDSFMIVRLTGF